ncbi:hypothetical protein [Skermania piniformis]|uniref:Nuclear transport factor 2 family protein n=1 Tax=Skermania pinensis TaxID=39122 RepID=A0ABX8S932_9ACTN|nr:hypothetical protein [Skermania piniformis]QXQ13502.1 nuclear transport factor 2 family protein [Skermania piniformis]
MSTSAVATVLAWHDALNGGDVDTLLELSSDDIEIAGAAGGAQGLLALRVWATTAGIRLEAGRMYTWDGIVVTEQQLTRSGTSAPAETVASAFRVVHDHVTSVFQHPDLATALAATDLGEKDLVADD